MPTLTRMAICYDFYHTLSPDDMQAYAFIPSVDFDKQTFWAESNADAKRHHMDKNLAWMKKMLDEAIRRQKSIKRETFQAQGGAVELYERVEDAAARELREETGLIAEELTLLGVFSGERLRLVYPNGDPVSNVDVVFLCHKYHGELTPQVSEVDRLQFFAVDALPEPFFPCSQPGMEAYLALRQGR